MLTYCVRLHQLASDSLGQGQSLAVKTWRPVILRVTLGGDLWHSQLAFPGYFFSFNQPPCCINCPFLHDLDVCTAVNHSGHENVILTLGCRFIPVPVKFAKLHPGGFLSDRSVKSYILVMQKSEGLHIQDDFLHSVKTCGSVWIAIGRIRSLFQPSLFLHQEISIPHWKWRELPWSKIYLLALSCSSQSFRHQLIHTSLRSSPAIRICDWSFLMLSQVMTCEVVTCRSQWNRVTDICFVIVVSTDSALAVGSPGTKHFAYALPWTWNSFKWPLMVKNEQDVSTMTLAQHWLVILGFCKAQRARSGPSALCVHQHRSFEVIN